MHVVSFYSFKGGVGRTMALINVGYELARLGRKVLLVDFDLEAPGLASYEPFASNADVPGVVDYVTRYIDTGEAPDVRDFIMSYGAPSANDYVPLWLMPAGRKDGGYADRLSSIDWTDLYATRSGFLLFEDLKQQWAEMPEDFDYVLLDSRTGLTDVAGICTRQLPDTVCLMFLPNDQNIDGLSLVVPAIRAEDSSDRRTRLLFCPSNVPFLDDEFGVLRSKLEEARERLGFQEPAATVHRYESMSLLDQAIFVRDRATTRLAGELRSVTKAVMRGNLRDREGALAELEVLTQQLFGDRSDLPRADAGGRSFLTAATLTLSDIQKYHPDDGEVAYGLATVYQLLGDVPAEADALNTAIEEGHRANEARLRRGLGFLAVGRREDAADDLRAVVASRETSAIDLWMALEALQDTDADLLEALEESDAVNRLAPDDLLRISHLLKSNVDALTLATEIAESVRAKSHGSLRHYAETELSLSLIGAGEFRRALELLGPTREEVLASKSVTRSFNYAMAQWGLSGQTDADLLRHTLVLAEDWRGDDANAEQCLALCRALIGERDSALDHITVARRLLGAGQVFSCWRYLRVSSDEMRTDLDALARMIDGGGERPAFLRRRTSH